MSPHQSATAWEFTEAWLPKGWSFGDLFEWPPDAFAWTSCLLLRTGAYRFAVSPPCPWPDDKTWTRDVNTAADEWLEWVAGKRQSMPARLDRHIEALKKAMASTTMSAIGATEDTWHCCRDLLELHAIADRCCAGFGSPGINYKSSDTEVQFLADTLLTRYGSISRLPKHIGLVLPKMRTPQNGVTLRALSLYATFHESEIEIVWRCMPWVNVDENTINLLIVPWPHQVQATWFRPRARVGQRVRSGRSRYFSFDPETLHLDPELILSLIDQAAQHASRVHVIVFPELSITRRELMALQSVLEARLPRDRIPMIVAGVRSSRDEVNAGQEPRNRVVLSAFFAEKWYDLEQDKHHRWKLDQAQIEQYSLGGALTGAGAWWEGYEIRRRRLTFLAPNDWLVLSPLICEDLAQLEPVSDVIRGVGPTLVWALLLDGPQLPHRWAARYASVLADDPGSSVLTVTALGMSCRSRPRDVQIDPAVQHTVALWKDREAGWRSIQVPEGAGGALLTVCAAWHEEFTVDGRGDNENAALFVARGVQPIVPGADYRPADRSTAAQPWSRTDDRRDIKELTVFTQLVDAALDADVVVRRNLSKWAVGERCDVDDLLSRPGFSCGAAILDLIAADESPNDPELSLAIEIFVHEVDSFAAERGQGVRAHEGQLERWSLMVNRARDMLTPLADVGVTLPELTVSNWKNLARQRIVRAHIAVWSAILWAIHNRLTEDRRRGRLNQTGASLLDAIQGLQHLRYDDRLRSLQEA